MTGSRLVYSSDGGRVVPPKDGESRRSIRGLLDPRFESFDKSGLRLTVPSGNNDNVTIEVEPPPRR